MEKLEVINLQLARQKAARRRFVHWAFIFVCVIIVAVFAVVVTAGSPYLNWNYGDPETAVFGAALHVFEWGFVRVAPLAFIGAIVGAVLTRRRS